MATAGYFAHIDTTVIAALAAAANSAGMSGVSLSSNAYEKVLIGAAKATSLIQSSPTVYVDAVLNATDITDNTLQGFGSIYIAGQSSVPAYAAVLIPADKLGNLQERLKFTAFFVSAAERNAAIVDISTTFDDDVRFMTSLSYAGRVVTNGAVGGTLDYSWVSPTVASNQVRYVEDTADTAIGLSLGSFTTTGNGVAVALKGNFVIPLAAFTGSAPTDGASFGNDGGQCGVGATLSRGQVLKVGTAAVAISLDYSL